MINLIYELQRKGISLWNEQENVRIFLPHGVSLSEEEKVFLKKHKSKILAILKENRIYKKTENSILKTNSAKVPLSFAQERLRFIELYENGTFAYLFPVLLELNNDLDIKILKQSLGEIVARHEILRTVFANDKKGSDFQKVLPDVPEIKEKRLAITALKAELEMDINVIFDLNNNYPIQITIYYTEISRYLLINIHHIAFDGWSLDILLHELEACYRHFAGHEIADLPELRVQYRDFTVWQREYLKEEVLKRHLDYWKQKLAGFETLLFPADKPQPLRIDYRGEVYEFAMDKVLSERLRCLAKFRGVSLYTLLLSAFYVLLNKYTGQTDLIIGTPVANRDHEQIAKLIGFFANILPQRIKISTDATFAQLLTSVQNNVLELQTYQELPFEKLVDLINVERDQGRNAVFQTVFLMQSFGQSKENNLFQVLNVEDYYKIAKFELSLAINDKDNQLKGKIFYKTVLFYPETILRCANHYLNILRVISADEKIKIRDINILGHSEYNQLIYDWNNTASDYPKDKSIQELFAEVVAANRERIAVECGKEKLTYEELNCKANQLARHLNSLYRKQHGRDIPADTLIAIGLERSIEMIVGILAILKAGAAYVPIDPGYPRERIEYILKDTAANLYLADIPSFEKSYLLSSQQNCKNSDYIKTAGRQQITDLDKLPFPDRSLIDLNKYNKSIGLSHFKNYISLFSSRGCPYNCAYCHKIWPKRHVFRSAQNLFSEVKMYYELGYRNFGIFDDIFNLNLDNSRRFFELLLKHNLNVQLSFPNGIRGDILTTDYIDLMVAAGTRQVSLALETASPRLQKLIKKNLNVERLRENACYIAAKHPNVMLDIFAMFGFPTESEEEAVLTLEFVKSVRWLHFPIMSFLHIYPNTDMEKLYLENGGKEQFIYESKDSAYHELPKTLPFSHEFAKWILAEFISSYFLNKERLIQVLPHQVKILTEDAIVQKYNSYLNAGVNSIEKLLSFCAIEDKLRIPQETVRMPDVIDTDRIYKYFPQRVPDKNALRVLLLDLSQYFEHDNRMLFDVIEQPLGLISLLSYLYDEFGSKIQGRIAKSRVDFNNYGGLSAIIHEFKPDVIGIRTLSFYKDFFHRTVSFIRSSGHNIPIIAGGPYATSEYDLLINDHNVDIVVLGEGELTFAEIIGKMLANNKLLPSEDELRHIAGIAFLPKEQKKSAFVNTVILKDNPLIESSPGTNLTVTNSSRDLAYVIYTSGTTGKPKGVMVEHSSVVSLVRNSGYIRVSQKDVFLHLSHQSFDAATFEIWGALLNGAKLVVAPHTLEILSDAREFKYLLTKYAVSVLWLTRSLFDYLYEEDSSLFASLRYLITGGEALTPKLISRLCGQEKRPQFILNGYGPTEATTFSTTHQCAGDYLSRIPIGKPLNNRKAYVLDCDLHPAPIGVTGELYLAGAGIARGYLKDPALTAKRFIRNPFANEQDIKEGYTRLYKTSDMVRWLPDGNLDFIGRVDLQIKLRGFRIELQEIENGLLRYGAISQAAVLVKERQVTEGESRFLVAYYVSNEPVNERNLIAYLEKLLPQYMIPAFFVNLKVFPITENGKLDRKSLPDPDYTGQQDDYVEPINDIEEILVTIWREVLGLEKISVRDDFFRKGGDSILSIQLSAKLRKHGFQISVRNIFDYRTIERLAEYLKSSDCQTILSLTHQTEKDSKSDNNWQTTDFPKVSLTETLLGKLHSEYDIEAINPANSLQQGFVYHALSYPNDDAYRVQIIFDYFNRLDLNLLKTAWEMTIRKHPALRTCFNWDDDLIQITDRRFKLNWFEHDLTDAEDKEKRIIGIQEADRKVIFDLTRACLLRLHVIKHTDEHYTFIESAHHSILDGWSFPIILNSVHNFYQKLIAGDEVKVQEEKIYFTAQDYYYQNQMSVSAYWKSRIQCIETVNDINNILSKTADPDSLKAFANYGEKSVLINGALYEKLRQVIRNEGITLNVLLQFAWHKLIQTYTQDKETIIGTTVSGRDIPVEGIEASVGLYINTLPLLINWHDVIVREQLQNIHREITGISTNSFVNLASLQKDGKRLFHSIFVFENYPLTEQDNKDGLTIEFKKSVEKLDYPLSIIAYDYRDGLTVRLKYAADYLTEAKAKRLLKQIKTILMQLPDGLDKSVNAITLIDDDERKLILNDWNQTDSPYPADKTLPELFFEQTICTPNQIAVVYEGSRLTYSELNMKANQIAHSLKQAYKNATGAEVKGDVIIGIYLERSLEMIAGILGILKAGAAYLPFALAEPVERLRFKIQESGMKVVLISEKLTSEVELFRDNNVSVVLINNALQNTGENDLPFISKASDLAYVLYTSGSTGQPKGVMVEHRSVINTVYDLRSVYRLREGANRVSAYSAYTFDVSVSEFFVSLIMGGELHVLSEETRNDAEKLAAYINENDINYMFLPPAMLGVLPDPGYKSLSGIIFAGEPCDEKVGRYWANRYSLYNYYGPTEATIYVTGTLVGKESVNIIGKPISNNQAYIFDNSLNPVPVGVIGELYIGGLGVARGYLKRPDMTKKRFPEVGFLPEGASKRLYKTGDLVRWCEDGQIEFIGRNDNQIKLRGFRIELGEIESCILEFPGMEKCVVVFRERDNNKYLAAYYVAKAGRTDEELLRAHLSKSLPEYMIPGFFICLDSMPITSSGKTDRQALPEPKFAVNEIQYHAPVNDTEALMCEIWSKLLGIIKIGTRDDFFQSGGDSILSIQLCSRLRSNNIHLTVRDIFAHRTIEKLTRLVAGRKESNSEAEQGILEGAFELLPVQQWFFEKGFKKKNHFNQAILFKTPELSLDKLRNAVISLTYHHDALRMTFKDDSRQYFHPQIATPAIKYLDISESDTEDIPLILTKWQSGFDIDKGPLWQFGYLTGYADGSVRFFLALHHLIEDAVSLRIIMEDILDLYAGKRLPAKTFSYRQWVDTVKDYANRNMAEAAFWKELITRQNNKEKYGRLFNEIRSKEFRLLAQTSAMLLHEANDAYHTNINDLLLCALSYSLSEWHAADDSFITLEGHGREDIASGVDVSRTVGWFTTMFPFQLSRALTLPETIKNIKEALRSIPNKGLGYGALKYFGNDLEIRNHKLPAIIFNYLGQLAGKDDKFGFVLEDSGQSVAFENHINTIININAVMIGGELVIRIAGRLSDEDIDRFSASLLANLQRIAVHCQEKGARGDAEYSSSDFPTVKISQALLDRLQKRYAIQAIYPAGSLQQGFVYHHLSNPDDNAYRIQFIIEYLNLIDADLLQQAWEMVVAACPALRLCFNWDEEILQIIDRKVHLNWVNHDISCARDQETLICKIQDDDRRQGFDLSHPGLFRLHLIKQGDEHYTFIKTVHYSISDGWSLPVELARVHDIYQKLVNKNAAKLNEETAYLEAQEHYHRNKEDVVSYWEEKIGKVETVNDLNDLLSVKTDLDGIKSISDDKEISIVIDQAIFCDIKTLVRKEGLTLNAVVQFVWHKLLEIYTGDRETIVGTVISGRDIPVAGIENSVGLYINTLPMIVSWEEKTVREQLKEIHAGIVALNNNSHVHLASLQKEGKRLFHSLFVFENYPKLVSPANKGLLVKYHTPIEKMDYPVSVLVSGGRDELKIKLKYAGEYLHDQQAQRLLNQMLLIMGQIQAKLNDFCHTITIVSHQERDLLLNYGKQTEEYDINGLSVHEMFRLQSVKTPDNIAISCGGKKLTYQELNNRSNQLAQLIRKKYKDNKGAELPDRMLIGLYIGRSLELIIGVLGILKAGGAYVPFDTTEPGERLGYKISDCGCQIILTSSALAENLRGQENKAFLISLDTCQEELEQMPVVDLQTICKADDLAYVIYTSGTTGQPKGSLITHQNVIRLFQSCDKHFTFTGADVWTLFHAISFDFTVWEIWGALLYGGKLVIPEFEETRDTSLFYQLLEREKVTVLNQTPSAFAMLSQTDDERPERLSSLRYIVFGGEALNVSSLQSWISKYGMDKPELINMYGITETTVHVTFKRLTEADIRQNVSNIGKPLADLTAYVLDSRRQLVPVGVFGELYIGGAGVCRGYLNRPELTAERFIPNPFGEAAKKERLYKTGDIARWLFPGDLEYRGRNDSQIKIRGFRIELGEIERKILLHDSVGQCLVRAHDKNGNKQIIAYYIATKDISKDALRQHVTMLLPDYMTPFCFIEMQKFPLTVNGKIDFSSLPEPELGFGDTHFAEPRDEAEKTICAIWAEVLGLSQIGIYDNFFLIGGDSIVSIKVVAKMKEAGFAVSVRDLFIHKNIASFRANIQISQKEKELKKIDVIHWEF